MKIKLSKLSLDVAKLEKIQKVIHDGQPALVARCPACAESGHDRTGNHLIVFPTGAFGCVVNQGDKKHKQRIWELAGRRGQTVHPPPMARPEHSVRAVAIEKRVRSFHIKG